MDSRVGHFRRMVGEGLAVLPPCLALTPPLWPQPFPPIGGDTEPPALSLAGWRRRGAKREGWPAVSVSHFPTRRAVRATFTPAPGRRLLQETLNQNGKLF
jgi:hypothetical protein